MRIFFFLLLSFLASLCIAQTKDHYSIFRAATLDSTIVRDTSVATSTSISTQIKDSTISSGNYIIDTITVSTISIDSTYADSLGIDSSRIDTIKKTSSILTRSNIIKDSIGVTTDTITSYVVTVDTIRYKKISGDSIRVSNIDTIINVTYANTSAIDTLFVTDSISDTVPHHYTIVEDTISKVKITDSITDVNTYYIDSVLHRTILIDTINLTNAQPHTTIIDTTIIHEEYVSIGLPFFEDFSTSPVGESGYPRWIGTGGTYVNNGFGLLPPSQNVVTFDGINAKGVPYGYSSPYYGYLDTLTSWPIDLSSLTLADSIYFSFYWQEGGYGDPPTYIENLVGGHYEVGTEYDSITLFFKDSTQNWDTAWSARGINSLNPTAFMQKLIGFKDSTFANYLHSNFQFRFVNYGPRFSERSAWNLDYIILNTNRNYADTTHPDITIISGPNHILKNYTAMPADQFFANPMNELADSITLRVKNWGSVSDNLYTLSGANLDAIINKNDTIYSNYSYTINGLPAGDTALAQMLMPSIDSLHLLNDTHQVVFTKIKLHTPDRVVAGIDYTMNDTITISTVLHDYFAYDDGVAEWPIIFNTNQDDFAVEYSLNKEDSLTGVKIYFPQITYQNSSGTDSANGAQILIVVWDTIMLGTTNGDTLGFGFFYLSYSPIDSFVTYNFATPIHIPAGNFYVGLGYIEDYNNQGTTLLVGLDANNDHTDKIFWKNNSSNQGDTWVNVDSAQGVSADSGTTSIKGSLMVRPIFSNKQNTPTGITQRVNTLDCTVYPNPTTGVINISGKVSNAKVYDLTGKLLAEQNFNSMDYSKTMDLQNFNDGLYLIYLSNGNSSVVKKVILTR